MSYRIIDVDTHITEPADVWKSRVARKYVDRVPHVERLNGKDIWLLQGKYFGAVGPTAQAGWHKPLPDVPSGYQDILPASFDSKARLELMDKRGVWAEVLYPNVAGFGGQRFLELKDRELMYECVRAYNDFQSDWCSADPRRLIPTMATPFWDVDACVREVTRCAAKGFRAVNFTGEPHVFGFPFLGESYWDPFWAKASDHGMVISFHVGSGEITWAPKRMEKRGFIEEYTLQAVSLFQKSGLQVCELLVSGVLPRFPDLRFVSVESGIGWIPFALEALDYQFKKGEGFKSRPEFKKLPSEYFAEQVYATFWFEEVALRDMMGGRIPIDNVLFESDFPHPTCLFENFDEQIHRSLGHLPDSKRHQLLWGNAQKLYGVNGPAPTELN